MIAPLLGLLAAGGLSALNTQGGILLDRRRQQQDAQGLLAGLQGQGVDVDPGVAAALQTGQMGLGQDLLTQQQAALQAQQQIAQRGNIQTALQGQRSRDALTLQEGDQAFRQRMAEQGHAFDVDLLGRRFQNDLTAQMLQPQDPMTPAERTTTQTALREYTTLQAAQDSINEALSFTQDAGNLERFIGSPDASRTMTRLGLNVIPAIATAVGTGALQESDLKFVQGLIGDPTALRSDKARARLRGVLEMVNAQRRVYDAVWGDMFGQGVYTPPAAEAAVQQGLTLE